MNEKLAIILCTRITKYPENNGTEWRGYWGFDDNNSFALRSNSTELEEKKDVGDLLAALVARDNKVVVWLNGSRYDNKTSRAEDDLNDIIGKLDRFSVLVATHGIWPELSLRKEGIIFSHFSSTEKPEYEEILLNLKEANQFEKRFDKAWNYLKTKQKIVSLSVIKHRISHVFSAVDTDLQGLWDESQQRGQEGFEPNYWKEVVQAYKEVDWEEEFREVENLEFRGKKIFDVVKDELKQLKGQSIELLKLLKDEKARQEAYDLMKKGKGISPLHNWLRKLDNIFDNMLKGSRYKNKT